MNNIQEKLKKIKALAERGVDGEKEQAQVLYDKLLAKYEISPETIDNTEEIKMIWFKYHGELEKKLLAQVFYKVTGSLEYWVKTDKRKHLLGVYCTEFEVDEILFYFRFYNEHFKNELDIFISAFMNKNNIFPDPSARCYAKTQEQIKDKEDVLDLDRLDKMLRMQSGMDSKSPLIGIENKENKGDI